MPVSRLTAEGLADEVAEVYARAEVLLLQLIGRHLAAGQDSPRWAEDKLASLQLLRRQAHAIMAAATAEAVAHMSKATQTAYLRGAAAAEDELQKLLRHTDDLTPRQASHAVRALIRANAGLLDSLGPQVVRHLTDAYRNIIVRAAGEVLTGTTTRLQATQRALDDLARHGITGFVDSAGRRWGLESYAEMATRTTTAQAAVIGHMDRLEDGGINTFLVSDSPRECPRCQPWEGKVLTRGPVAVIAVNAITGEREQVQVDGTVEDATAGGLFHPNCTHNLSGYVQGVTRRGEATANPSGYVERQEQRRLERGVREWKRREAVALTPEAARAAKAKVREWQGRLGEHTSRTGLPRKRNRESLTAAR